MSGFGGGLETRRCSWLVIKRPTFNARRSTSNLENLRSTLDVRCWAFGVFRSQTPPIPARDRKVLCLCAFCDHSLQQCIFSPAPCSLLFLICTCRAFLLTCAT